MVCDYYIERYLVVDYKGGASHKYELDFTHAYFPYLDIRDYDSEEELDQEYSNQYHNVMQSVEQLCLKPKLPVLIFCNGKFSSEKYKNKYDQVLKNKAGHLETISLVVIQEIRYEREKYFEYHPLESDEIR